MVSSSWFCSAWISRPGSMLVLAHQLEHQAQEPRIAGQQRVVVGRARHEVVRQVRAAERHFVHDVERQRELLEGEAAELAHHVGDQLVGRQRQRMARPPYPPVGVALDAEQTVGIEPQHAVPEHADLVHRIADHQPLGGERRVEPVERRLALLEVMQVDPAALHAVGAAHDVGGAPVGVLDAGLVEDARVQLADDVALRLQGVHRGRTQIDGVVAGGHRRQQPPVGGRDAHHVIDARDSRRRRARRGGSRAPCRCGPG